MRLKTERQETGAAAGEFLVGPELFTVPTAGQIGRELLLHGRDRSCAYRYDHVRALPRFYAGLWQRARFRMEWIRSLPSDRAHRQRWLCGSTSRSRARGPLGIEWNVRSIVAAVAQIWTRTAALFKRDARGSKCRLAVTKPRSC